jgi:hypothetical protein
MRPLAPKTMISTGFDIMDNDRKTQMAARTQDKKRRIGRKRTQKGILKFTGKPFLTKENRGAGAPTKR